MTETGKPPAIPRRRADSKKSRNLGVFLGVILGALFITILLCRALNLLIPYRMPQSGMAPALEPGDQIFSEGFTFLARKPHRGDIAIFRTAGLGTGINELPSNQVYIQRIAGEPGDHLELAGGKLYINGSLVTLSNEAGPITYFAPAVSSRVVTNLIVPADSYFMLGDNSINSYDSRYWGTVPRANIIGTPAFRYWPAGRIGGVK